MAKKIISNSDIQNHNIFKYEFKNLNIVSQDEEEEKQLIDEVVFNRPTQEKGEFPLPSKSEQDHINQAPNLMKNNIKEEEIIDNQIMQETPQAIQVNNEFSESMLKKVDELGSSLIKMEMRLEKQEIEFQERLKEEKERSYADGVKAGEEKKMQELEGEFDAKKVQINSSIQKMQSTVESFENVTKNIEKELIDAAIDIAKEVLTIEVSENSKEIALKLAKNLISDVKGAMKITIKAHPDDVEFLKQKITNQKIEIESDSAISLGGVIIESDAGCVDGSVMSRYEAIKKNILDG